MRKILLGACIVTSIFATETTQVTMADLKEATYLIIKDLKSTSTKLDDLNIRLNRMESNVNTSAIQSSLRDLTSKYDTQTRLINTLKSNMNITRAAPSINTTIKPLKTITNNRDFYKNQEVKSSYSKPLSISYDNNINSTYKIAEPKEIDTRVQNHGLSISYNSNSDVKIERESSKYDDEILEFIERNGY